MESLSTNVVWCFCFHRQFRVVVAGNIIIRGVVRTCMWWREQYIRDQENNWWEAASHFISTV